MEQIMEVYGYGIIQDCAGLLQALDVNNFAYSDFVKFVEKSKKENITSRIVNKPKKNIILKPVKKIKNLFIAPGELEKMDGVKCSTCQGEIFITATCCSNPLKRQGFLRKGICGSCGNEFGIR